MTLEKVFGQKGVNSKTTYSPIVPPVVLEKFEFREMNKVVMGKGAIPVTIDGVLSLSFPVLKSGDTLKKDNAVIYRIVRSSPSKIGRYVHFLTEVERL